MRSSSPTNSETGRAASFKRKRSSESPVHDGTRGTTARREGNASAEQAPPARAVSVTAQPNSPRLQQQSGSGRRGQRANVQNHVATEQRRRDRINEGFDQLRDLIPHRDKMDKASFLLQTVDYIRQLQDVLQQLLRLGALSDVPDDLQWTARMLLPKSVACAPADETRSPPQRPAPPATLAGWVPPSEPPPPAGPAQHDVATLAAAPDLTACAGTPAPVALTAPAVAAQPRPPSAGPAAIGPPQQPAVGGAETGHLPGNLAGLMQHLAQLHAQQAAAASAQQQMEQVALLPRMMAMAHVLAANDAQQRQTLWPPPAPHFADLPECAPLVMGGQQQQPQQQQQQQQQECADQLMALLAAGKAAEGDHTTEKSDISANAQKGQSAFGPCSKPSGLLTNGH